MAPVVAILAEVALASIESMGPSALYSSRAKPVISDLLREPMILSAVVEKSVCTSTISTG
ncbi:hypothetical protein [Seleniivibrio sp.]|uniref:hypothetical protein n=1 Tax=Seleniivibrio sp. TaxID=2898801 RepID=UPI0025E048CA|nr:hypothetical protein [Seleniivibrio sp.]